MIDARSINYLCMLKLWNWRSLVIYDDNVFWFGTQRFGRTSHNENGKEKKKEKLIDVMRDEIKRIILKRVYC